MTSQWSKKSFIAWHYSYKQSKLKPAEPSYDLSQLKMNKSCALNIFSQNQGKVVWGKYQSPAPKCTLVMTGGDESCEGINAFAFLLDIEEYFESQVTWSLPCNLITFNLKRQRFHRRLVSCPLRDWKGASETETSWSWTWKLFNTKTQIGFHHRSVKCFIW